MISRKNKLNDTAKRDHLSDSNIFKSYLISRVRIKISIKYSKISTSMI